MLFFFFFFNPMGKEGVVSSWDKVPHKTTLLGQLSHRVHMQVHGVQGRS